MKTRIKFIKGLGVNEISPEDVLEQFKTAADKNTKSYFLINLTNQVSTDSHNPPPGFVVEVNPVKNANKVVVSYFRVPQAYVLPEGLETTVRQALASTRTVELIDQGKIQKHKDCPDPTQYVTRNYSYEDAVTALNPRIEKKSFFGMAEKAAQAAPAAAISTAPQEVVPPTMSGRSGKS